MIERCSYELSSLGDFVHVAENQADRAVWNPDLHGATAALDFPAFEMLPARPELPDPLEMLDGTKVTTAAEWNNKRRPELKELFQHYMYGYLPPKPKKWVVEEVLFMDPHFMGGAATISESRLAFGGA